MARSVLRVSLIVEFLRGKVQIMWFGRAKGVGVYLLSVVPEFGVLVAAAEVVVEAAAKVVAVVIGSGVLLPGVVGC